MTIFTLPPQHIKFVLVSLMQDTSYHDFTLCRNLARNPYRNMVASKQLSYIMGSHMIQQILDKYIHK